MSKLVILFLSFFNYIFNTNLLFNDEEKEDFILVLDDATNEEEVLFESDNIKLSGSKNSYSFSIGDAIFNYQVDEAKVIVASDNVCIFCLDNGEFYYDVYSKKGTLLSKNNSITGSNVLSFGVVDGDEKIYIFYNSTYGDYTECYIYDLLNDEKKCLSNNKNEEIIDMIYYENYLYLALIKDAITEGVFGNGGLNKGLVIAKFNRFLQLDKYIVLDYNEDDIIRGLDINNDILFLENDKSIHLFSLNLVSINNKYVGNNYLITTDRKGLVYLFLEDKITILNEMSLSHISDVPCDLDILEVIKKDNYIFVKTIDKKYHLDIVDVRDFHIFKYLTMDNNEYYMDAINSLSSIYGDVSFIKKEYHDYYNPGSFGLYDVDIRYETKGKLAFTISVKENIPLECNIRNGVIYPNGYRVIFNGSGQIDGNAMLSNYQLKDNGKHEIVISGSNVQKRYEIEVDHSQKSFTNNTNLILEDYDVLPKNEKFSLIFSLNRNLDVKDIEVEGLAYSSFEVKDQELVLNFSGIREAGFYFVYIKYLTYEEIVNDDLIITNKYYIDKEFWYHVEKDDVTLSSSGFNNDMSFSFDLIDDDSNARYIEFELLGKSNNYLYKYPIGNTGIIFANLPDGDYELRAFIVYDTDKENLEKKILYNYMVRISGNVSYGELKVVVENSRFIKVRIIPDSKFLKNCINEIAYNKEVLYSHKEQSRDSVVIYSVVSFILAFGFGFLLRWIFTKTKNKKIL